MNPYDLYADYANPAGYDLGGLADVAAGGTAIPDMTTLKNWWNSANALNTKAATGIRGAAVRGAAHLPGKLGGAAISRFAASPAALTGLKFLTPIAAVSAVPAAGDVLFGGDSAANKIMDGTAMTIGGILGAPFGGPVGAAAGAGIGKSASDGLQWLFGDKKSAEQRRMEEALMALRGAV